MKKKKKKIDRVHVELRTRDTDQLVSTRNTVLRKINKMQNKIKDLLISAEGEQAAEFLDYFKNLGYATEVIQRKIKGDDGMIAFK